MPSPTTRFAGGPPPPLQGEGSDDRFPFSEQLSTAGLAAQGIETYATPRRLALIARGLPAETEAVREETKGPRTSAPPQALEGFLRKTGLGQDQLTERDGIYFAVVEKPGRATSSVLAEAIPAIIRAFPWPKSMRWGAASTSTESLRWVRPLQGIVALFGEEIVDFEVAGVRSGAATVGHRFHHSGPITIGSANDYIEKLKACHVVVDQEERRRLIREGAAALAAEAGLTLVDDEGLVAENAGLTEWPVPLLGRFDPAFLDVPPEVIQLTMRTNQKYFALTAGEGRLAPNFICTANIEASDGGTAIAAGNEKVLAARLSDAKFFWEQDLKIPLEDQAKKLSQIVFHEKLGTVADKVDRVAKLARWLVEEGIVTPSPCRGEGQVREANQGEGPSYVEGTASPSPSAADAAFPSPLQGEGADLAALAERAARLAKADLVTGMVGEFPELQGLIGGYLARAQGEDPQVADAIRDHYKPAGQGDDVPTSPATVAVSLADKLDSLVSFFVIKQRPTGSRDPFALRRAALGIIELILRNGIRLELDYATSRAANRLLRQHETGDYERDQAWMKEHIGAELFRAVPEFFEERLKVQQREAGARHDLIDAVFALGQRGNDIVSNLARVRALQAFVETAEGRDLLAGYKRAANILKKEGWAGHPAILAGPEDQDIPQTGEEDPLVLIDDPILADAVSQLAHPEQGANKTLSYTPEKEEADLIQALDSAEPRARAAVEAEEFEGAMAALASLRAPVDAFFDKVTVNDPDADKRAARLNLLLRIRDAVHAVADFSRIEG
ncbi:MAG: glycine--tRNA ligase subunit beta [Alphaproteobacteria bacterium]|nr:MAG: glycine--tRNA ligase subunit beta [Alphaproteobacteria bacterium]